MSLMNKNEGIGTEDSLEQNMDLVEYVNTLLSASNVLMSQLSLIMT